MMPAEGYDQVEAETRRGVAEQERRVAAEQGQARRLLEGKGARAPTCGLVRGT
jgi:hypothetical protein